MLDRKHSTTLSLMSRPPKSSFSQYPMPLVVATVAIWILGLHSAYQYTQRLRQGGTENASQTTTPFDSKNIASDENTVRTERRAVGLGKAGVAMIVGQGVRAAESGDYETALKLFDQAIARDPYFDMAYDSRATAWNAVGEYQKAIDDANQALKLNSNNGFAYAARGSALLELGNVTEAIDDFTQALRLERGHHIVYNNRGVAYFQLKDYQRAIADFTEAIKTRPDEWIAYLGRGQAYAGLKNYSSAIEDLSEAIKLAPDSATAYSERGRTYQAQNNSIKALQDLEKASILFQQQGDEQNYRIVQREIQQIQQLQKSDGRWL